MLNFEVTQKEVRKPVGILKTLDKEYFLLHSDPIPTERPLWHEPTYLFFVVRKGDAKQYLGEDALHANAFHLLVAAPFTIEYLSDLKAIVIDNFYEEEPVTTSFEDQFELGLQNLINNSQ